MLSLLFAIGAVVAGLSRAAKAGKQGWFVTILADLIGSVLVTVIAILALAQKVTDDPTLQTALGILILFPLLTPVLTLIYSFFG